MPAFHRHRWRPRRGVLLPSLITMIVAAVWTRQLFRRRLSKRGCVIRETHQELTRCAMGPDLGNVRVSHVEPDPAILYIEAKHRGVEAGAQHGIGNHPLLQRTAYTREMNSSKSGNWNES